MGALAHAFHEEAELARQVFAQGHRRGVVVGVVGHRRGEGSQVAGRRGVLGGQGQSPQVLVGGGEPERRRVLGAVEGVGELAAGPGPGTRVAQHAEGRVGLAVDEREGVLERIAGRAVEADGIAVGRGLVERVPADELIAAQPAREQRGVPGHLPFGHRGPGCPGAGQAAQQGMSPSVEARGGVGAGGVGLGLSSVAGVAGVATETDPEPQLAVGSPLQGQLRDHLQGRVRLAVGRWHRGGRRVTECFELHHQFGAEALLEQRAVVARQVHFGGAQRACVGHDLEADPCLGQFSAAVGAAAHVHEARSQRPGFGVADLQGLTGQVRQPHPHQQPGDLPFGALHQAFQPQAGVGHLHLEPRGTEPACGHHARGALGPRARPPATGVLDQRHPGSVGVRRGQPARTVALLEDRHGGIVGHLHLEGAVAQHHPVASGGRRLDRIPFGAGDGLVVGLVAEGG